MQEPSPQTRSDFVTTLAWIFIALAGFAVFISLLQNIMLNFFFPLDKMTSALQGPDGQRIPPSALADNQTPRLNRNTS